MTREHFGTLKDGRTVERITLENDAIRASIITLGATLQDLRMAGLDRPLTLGSSNVADYEDGGGLHYFGAIVGPVANRISKARTVFDGRELQFDANGLGGHVLHGGAAGLHHKLWQVEETTQTRLLLSTTAEDGEGGFPANRRFEAEFTLDGANLTLRLRVETDAPTLMNLANHSYWNLGDSDDFHGHKLQIDADTYLPCDETDIATGEIRKVAGTALDFRSGRELTASDSIDNNFCLSDQRMPLRPVGSLTGPDGVRLGIETTEPGLQIYDTRHLPPEGVPGHGGKVYRPRAGVAIEAQFWPDAPTHPAFPSIRMEPGETWEQTTRFTFSKG
ncbi:aldose epimerase family protein [Aliiruegeria sabulilitoris]|uniref:aldose epimerase family protein n=1 Tax=Aliiruegeria sabulilitoris TaxID=1510458 RepID=UPI00082B61E5|nr:aldose epimerase family protein [Aliiruegeria sabulilitoris]NDR59171.1 galactose mutarotase [Pseudoruegeria sp. M32A2M]